MKRLAFYIFIAITLLGSCTKEIGNTSNGVAENECVLLLNMGLSPLDISGETKASSGNWIQGSIAMTNVAIAIFDHETGERVFSGAQYPFTLINTTSAYRSGWVLDGFVPNPSKTYDLAFASNFCRRDDVTAFLGTSNWNALVDPAPSSRTFQFSRAYMSNSTVVADKWSEPANPYIAYYGAMYVNQWRSPMLTGTFQGLKLTPGGLNLVGFKKDGDAYVPTVDLPSVNSDCHTSLAALPTLYDASDGETDNTKRVMKISPIYSLVVVDGITNDTGGKLEITDIFMMNVPICHHLFGNHTYYFGASGNTIKDASGSGIVYSTGRDLVSGFKPGWIDDDFKDKTVDDNFARLLHYPAANKVTQAAFAAQYTATPYRYYYNDPVDYIYPMLDRLCVTKGDKYDDFTDHMSGNWAFLKSNFVLGYNTGNVRKAPFFFISENDGNYPNETTGVEGGKRHYLFATRLVIRGVWRESWSMSPEVVYYPIIVNGPDQAYNASYADDSQEKVNNFVKAGRRYIYNITLKNKGVYNPWAPQTQVKLGDIELKVDMWSDANVEIPEYIY